MDRNKQNQTNLTASGLTPLQEQAAILLASGKNISEVAEELSLNRGTIYQWQQKITFQCYFNFQRQEAKDTLKNGLFSLYNEALEAIKGCLTSENETIKLKAATYIIQKIEENPMGETDIRKVLKGQATKKEGFMTGWELETDVFDENEYRRLLMEHGVEDED